MPDFAQHGPITTFQQLNPAHLPRIEAEVTELSSERPISLVLPCHGVDLHEPALRHIVHELRRAQFLREIIISLSGIADADLSAVQEIFAPLGARVRFISCERAAGDLLESLGVEMPEVRGKGFNVWLALGLIVTEAESELIVLQDCDVRSFRRETLSRLCYVCLHPELRYVFAKAYYSSAADRLYGLVSMIFLAPLLEALAKFAPQSALLEFLRSFRYPLAGECAMSRDLAEGMPIDAGWSVEMGVLCEIGARHHARRVAQVEDPVPYDHRHHPLGDESGALFAMCTDIARTLVTRLKISGLQLTPEFLAALRQAFATELQKALRRSRALALINGLAHAAEEEQQTAALFERALQSITNAPAFPRSAAPFPAWHELIGNGGREAAKRFQEILLAE